MKVKIEFVRPGNQTYVVEGDLVIPDGPFSAFMAVDTGEGHVLFQSESVVRIDTVLDDAFMADLEVMAKSKEMALTNFAREYKRMNNSPGGHFA